MKGIKRIMGILMVLGALLGTWWGADYVKHAYYHPRLGAVSESSDVDGTNTIEQAETEGAGGNEAAEQEDLPSPDDIADEADVDTDEYQIPIENSEEFIVEKMFDKLLKRAESEEGIRRWTHARTYLRSALDLTTNTELRARASAQMGRVLLKEADASPWPNLLVAQQYLNAAIDYEKDPANLENDEKLLREAEERWVLYQLQNLPENGSYYEMRSVLNNAETLMTSPKQRKEYELFQANSIERVLTDRLWMNEYMQMNPTNIPVPEVRTNLYRKTLTEYDRLADGDRSELGDEARFRKAELMVSDGDFVGADEQVQKFLGNEPTIFIPDTMMIMGQIAAAQDNPRKACRLFYQLAERYGLNRELETELYKVIDELIAQGFYEKAAEILKMMSNLPEMRYQAADMRMRAEVLMAKYYFSAGNIDAAEDILGRLALGDYPSDIKQEAVAMLFDTELKRGVSPIQMLIIGLQAVDADPNNIKAKAILVKVAKTIENMGLYEYARDIYEKIAILGMAVTESTTATNKLPISIEDATLGVARCFYHEGDDVQANYLLRRICNSYSVGPQQGEAAYWWSMISYHTNQFVEASRRLSLIDNDLLENDLATQVQVQQNLVNLAMGISGGEIINRTMSSLNAMTEKFNVAFLHEAYTKIFDFWTQQEDLDAMIGWMVGSEKSPHKELIPVNTFFYTIANLVMDKQGVRGLETYLNDYSYIIDPEHKRNLAKELYLDYLPVVQKLRIGNEALKLELKDYYKKHRKLN
ncbi:MAG: hypothetical protein EOL87_06680 [Spartobacteria bacterium]|nr:hypothetical protein [Spartobacteria bacterium]